jgi:heparan-alpha-glucosaminide N-acetyltransferase
MMLVDYGGAIVPIIAHSPWNGLHLADFVMPFFLFIAGVSLALVYKVLSALNSRNRCFLRQFNILRITVHFRPRDHSGDSTCTLDISTTKLLLDIEI